MTPETKKTVHRTSLAAAVIAAILSPIPLADEIVFVPVYGVLTLRIARAHGLARRDVPWRPILRTAIAGLTARAGANIAVAYIPGVAAVANAVTAVALTELLGQYIDKACAAPASAEALTVKQLIGRLGDKLPRWMKKREPTVVEA